MDISVAMLLPWYTVIVEVGCHWQYMFISLVGCWRWSLTNGKFLYDNFGTF